MSGDDDWSELGATWRAQSVDLPRLRRETRWKTWRMRLAVAMELLSAAVLYGFALWAWDRPDTTDLHRYWIAFCGALMPLLLWLSLSARRGLWRAADPSVLGLLRLRIARARSGERLGWLTLAITAVMLVAASAWIALFDHLQPTPNAATAARRLWLWLGIVVFSLGWIGGSAWYIRACRRARARWQGLLRQLDEA